MQAQLTDSQTMLKNTKNSLGSEKNSLIMWTQLVEQLLVPQELLRL